MTHLPQLIHNHLPPPLTSYINTPQTGGKRYATPQHAGPYHAEQTIIHPPTPPNTPNPTPISYILHYENTIIHLSNNGTNHHTNKNDPQLLTRIKQQIQQDLTNYHHYLKELDARYKELKSHFLFDVNHTP